MTQRRGGNNGGQGGNSKGRGGGGGQNGNPGAGAKTCNKCQKFGHLAVNCRSNGNQSFKCMNCKMNNHTTVECTQGPNSNQNNKQASKNKATIRPCRFCQELHLDKNCPTKSIKFTATGLNYGDTSMKDVFGVGDFSHPCHHCGGQHLSHSCPNISQQSQDLYHYQRYPAQAAQVVLQMSLWDACDDIDEEFTTGDPWHAAPAYGPVYGNFYANHCAQPEESPVYYHMQQYRTDLDGDVIME
ncbi:hypothetical protein WAI453_002647 [Rhynchosporium graminicola]|uniref:CCHC-type domain-containing protein n=1 Tax=Rhynchosporium graminicola TaxID=2792576 RepID=A0A1E1JU64_9HELO|nr:uncharacterized protein RCO7_09005 [Rhynchosporium commune]